MVAAADYFDTAGTWYSGSDEQLGAGAVYLSAFLKKSFVAVRVGIKSAKILVLMKLRFAGLCMAGAVRSKPLTSFLSISG